MTPPPLSRDALNELARLAEKVPRGPWGACTCQKGCGQIWDIEHDMWVATVESVERTQDKGYSAEQQEDVMAFLVALVNAAPALIETARKAALPSRDALLYLAGSFGEYCLDGDLSGAFVAAMRREAWPEARCQAAMSEAAAWLRARLEEAAR